MSNITFFFYKEEINFKNLDVLNCNFGSKGAVCIDVYKKINTYKYIDNYEEKYKNSNFFEKYINNVIPAIFRIYIETKDTKIFFLDILKYNEKINNGVLNLNKVISDFVLSKLSCKELISYKISELGKVIIFDYDYSIHSIILVKINIVSSILDVYCNIDSCKDNNINNKSSIKFIDENYISKLYNQSEKFDPNLSVHENLINVELFKWGLIGNENIENYSFAPKLWSTLFELLGLPITYVIIATNNVNELQNVFCNYLNEIGTIGFNVAMPWKYWAYKQCLVFDEFCEKHKTINTIIKKSNSIYGYNSDGKGLLETIKNHCVIKNKNVLLIGCGGAVQSLPMLLSECFVNNIYLYDINKENLQTLFEISIDFCEKNNCGLYKISYDDFDFILPKIDIIINATPCGMKGKENQCVLNIGHYLALKSNAIFIETIYNPIYTLFLRNAYLFGNKIVSGNYMLVLQAVFSFQEAFGISLDDSIINLLINTLTQI